MKCGCMTFRNKKGRLVVIAVPGADVLHPEYYAELVQKHGKPSICDGTLSCKIEAVDTPDYCSNHYAELRITYICSKDPKKGRGGYSGGRPQHTFFPAIPDVEEIQDIVAKFVKDLSPVEVTKRLKKWGKQMQRH